jgi:chaperonin GroES
MLKPLFDHVVIELLREEKKKNRIILPDTVDKEKSEKGKIVAVGPGKIGDNGKRILMEVKKGDIVLFTKYGPHEVKIEGKEYLIARQDDILAVVK